MKNKYTQPWIFPDRTIVREDSIKEHWLLYAFEGPGGLYPIGASQPPVRESVIAKALKDATGKQCSA